MMMMMLPHPLHDMFLQVMEDRAISSLGPLVVPEALRWKNDSLSSAEHMELLSSIISDRHIIDLNLFSSSDLSSDPLRIAFDRDVSKENRTVVHKAIKALFDNLDSRTEASDPSSNYTYITVHRKDFRAGRTGNRREGGDTSDKVDSPKVRLPSRWDSSNPEYHHFTVIKQNYNNADMLSYVSRRMSLLPSRLGYCGIKDKHAVTMQRLSAWRVDRQLIDGINRAPKSFNVTDEDTSSTTISSTTTSSTTPRDSILVRDVSMASSPLKVGDLMGNHFVVTLRQRSLLSRDSTSRAVDRIRTVGGSTFPNLFGSQRFGSPLRINPLVGEMLIKGDYCRAVFLLLLSPISDVEVILTNSTEEYMKYLVGCDHPSSSNSPLSGLIHDRWAQHVHILREAISPERNTLNGVTLTFESSDDAQLRSNAMEVCNAVTSEIWRDGSNKSHVNDIEATSASLSDIEEDDIGDEAIISEDVDYTQEGAAEDLMTTVDNNASIVSDARSDRDKHSALMRSELILRILGGDSLSDGAGDYRQLLRSCGGQMQKTLWKELLARIDSHHAAATATTAATGSPKIVIDKLDYAAIFAKLQKSLRLLFVNSYQSLLWNECVEQRLQLIRSCEHGEEDAVAVEGDVVLVDAAKNPLTAWSLTHKKYTTTNSDRVDHWTAKAKPLCVSTTKTRSSIEVHKLYYHSVTRDDEDRKLYPMTSVVLPLPGDAAVIPAVMRRRLVDDGTLALVHGNHSNSLFKLPGAYRHVLSQVKNLRYQVEDISSSVDRRTWGNWSTVIYDVDESSLFAKEVETKWRNQMIPSLLDRIYPTDTSPYLSRSLLEDITAVETNASISGRSYFDEDGVIRLAFSLCSSSYATTYLDWLLMP